ncbi:hypothetical protein BGZ79_001949 [Entomortierella chlamydospora]|nr:hypothetical protein BGZ79_001949 [Entomortierella chlamydospora]
MTLQVARAVDNLERYNVTRSNVNIYNNEWAKLLLDPINNLLHQHPLLAHVVGDHLTAKPMFLCLENIDLLELIRIVPIKTPAEVGRVFEQEHNLPFDLSNQSIPLWRLTIAPIEEGDTQSFYLLYTFHHVIGDGRSAMALTDQLVQHLNLQAKKATNGAVFSNSSNTTKIQIASTKPIPESIESRINCYPSLRTLICEATRALLLPGFLKKALEIKYWAGELDSSLETPNVTELALLQLTTQETLKVIQAAKRHSTTVQAILYTASVFAAKFVFMSNRRPVPLGEGPYEDDNNPIEEEAIVFATPVSLRDLIPNPIAPDDQGNYTSEFLDYNVRVWDDSSFWEMTAVYRRRIIEATTTARGLQDLLEHFGMLSLLPKKDGGWESYMVSKVHKDQHGRKATIKLSNIGRGWEQSKTTSDDHVAENGNDDDVAIPRFLIKDGVFSQSSGVTASALTMSVATANGVMTISTTWQKAAFRGRARGELFMSEFKRILFEAIEDGKVDYMFKDAKR